MWFFSYDVRILGSKRNLAFLTCEQDEQKSNLSEVAVLEPSEQRVIFWHKAAWVIVDSLTSEEEPVTAIAPTQK